MSGYLSGLIGILGINIIFAYSIYICAATGQLNLGGAGFQAIGAYACAVLSEWLGLPIPIMLMVSMLAGGIIGFLIAFPILRTKGVYMVLATFAFAEIVAGIILNSPALGGPTGLVVADYIETGVIIWTTLAVVVFSFYLLSTRIGLAMRAVHDDEAVADLMGVNRRAVQIGAFAIGGAFAGLSGGLYALYFGFVEAQYFNAYLSIFVLLYVLIGGTQTAWGPLVGASFFTLVPEALRIGDDWRFFIFGLIIVIMMILRPEGMVTREGIERVMAKLFPTGRYHG
jgi:branched-chain amino acid transport system permease protein